MHSLKKQCARSLGLLGLLLGQLGVANATVYTDPTAFNAALGGMTVGTQDFEGTSPGVVSGATLPLPGTGVSVTLPPFVDDVLAPPGTLDVIVVQDTGDNPTTSGVNSLGANDPGNFNTFTALADIDFSFSAPVNAFGLYVITPDEQEVTLFDDDIQLVADGQTVSLALIDSISLGLIGGLDFNAYYLGVTSVTGFTGATLTYGPLVPDGGAFFFNVDDLTVALVNDNPPPPPRVPVPGITALLAIGWLGMRCGLGRKRTT